LNNDANDGTHDAGISPFGSLIEVPAAGTRSLSNNHRIPVWIRRTIPAGTTGARHVFVKMRLDFSTTGGDPDPFFHTFAFAFDIAADTPAVAFSPDRKVSQAGGSRLTATVTSVDTGLPVEGLDVDFAQTVGPGTLTVGPIGDPTRTTDAQGKAFASYQAPDGNVGDTVTFGGENLMSFRSYPISLGTSTTAESSTTILGSGSAGTRGALRCLIHPDVTNFPNLLYYRNPDDDFNIDNDVLFAPVNQVSLTEGTTQVTRSTRGIDDVLVTEVWQSGRGTASMPTSFFRLLYEYFVNPPPFSATTQTFIQWKPRDRNTNTYNVELVDLRVGRGSDASQRFHVKDVYESGAGVGTLETALDAIDPGVDTGLLADTVTLVMRIVSKE
jgi:hypothetical protein